MIAAINLERSPAVAIDPVCGMTVDPKTALSSVERATDAGESDAERGTLESPSAYEHLLLDSLRGDPTFFARADEVEAAWAIVDPAIASWATARPSEFPNYAAGSVGPAAAEALLARDGRRWYDAAEQIACAVGGQHAHELRRANRRTGDDRQRR